MDILFLRVIQSDKKAQNVDRSQDERHSEDRKCLLDHPFAVPSLPQCVASVSGSLFQRNSPITIGSNVIKVVIMIVVLYFSCLFFSFQV